MLLERRLARRIGFVAVAIAGVWLELSPWGERVTGAVLELQTLALTHLGVSMGSGGGVTGGAGVPEARPLSNAMALSLVVIGALVWWESRRLVWAVASSLIALAALLAVSTMMLPRGVLVPTAGPGFAIVAGMLGRQALESVFALGDRRRRRHGSHDAPRDRHGSG